MFRTVGISQWPQSAAHQQRQMRGFPCGARKLLEHGHRRVARGNLRLAQRRKSQNSRAQTIFPTCVQLLNQPIVSQFRHHPITCCFVKSCQTRKVGQADQRAAPGKKIKQFQRLGNSAHDKIHK